MDLGQRGGWKESGSHAGREEELLDEGEERSYLLESSEYPGSRPRPGARGEQEL